MSYATELNNLYTAIRGSSWERGMPLMYQALALATEADDQDAIYQLHLAILTAASATGVMPSTLASFAAAVELHTKDPARFGIEVTRPIETSLSYQTGLVLAALTGSAAVDRTQIEQALASLRQLYELHGTAHREMPEQELCAALALGDTHTWGSLADKVRQQPLNATTTACPACLQRDLVRADLGAHGFEAARAEAERLLASDWSCPIEPVTTVSKLLVPALLGGHTEFVTQHFDQAYSTRLRLCEERLNMHNPLLPLLALTENVALGLDLFERRLPDLALVLYRDSHRLEFFAGSALLLDRATSRGLGQRAVRDTANVLDTQGIAGPNEVVATLAPKLWAAAEAIAARFDAGRGNTFRRDRVAEIRSWSSISLPLPLGPDVAEPLAAPSIPPPRTGQEWAARAKVRSMLTDWIGTVDACDRALAHDDLDVSVRCDVLAHRLRARAELVQAAAEVTSISELDDATQRELEAEFAEYIATMIELGKPTRAAILSALGLARYDRHFQPDPDHLAALLEQFADASPSDRAVLESHLAIVLAGTERTEEAAELAIRSADHAETDPDPEIRQFGRLLAGDLLASLGRPEARVWLERLVTDAAEDPSVQVIGLMLLTQIQARADELPAAAETIRRAVQLYIGIDAAPFAANAARIQAAILEDLGDLAGAIRATRHILQLTEAVEGFDRVPARVALGRLLVLAGQADQGLDVLVQADAELQNNGQPDLATSLTCAFWLGQAELRLGRPETAANLWQAALDLARGEHGDPEQVPMFSRALGNLLADYAQWDAALEAYETMRELAEASENPLARVSLAERVGLVTCLKGDPAGVEILVQARAQAEVVEATWAAADLTDSLARGLQALGRIDEAVASALEASDRFTAAGDEPGGRRAFTLAATMLAQAERVDEAIALLEPVADQDPDWAGLLTQLRENRS